jgi:hypothetical protein
VSPLRKVKNDEMPLRLQDSKDHKEMIITSLKLVMLCGFVPLWQNYTFRSGLKCSTINSIYYDPSNQCKYTNSKTLWRSI